MFTGVWLIVVSFFIAGVVYGDVTSKEGGNE
jgi:hypothetical protein